MQVVLGSTHQQTIFTCTTKSILMVCLLLSLPLLSACSSNSENPPPLTAQPIKEKAQSTFSNNDKIEALINAEFTLQREGPNKAFELFYEQASQSGDIRLIERLTHIAIISQNPTYIERSANLWLAADANAETAYALKLQVLVKSNRTEEVTTLLTNAIRHKVSVRFLPLYLEENVRDSDQVNTIEASIEDLSPELKSNQYVQLTFAHLQLLSGNYQQAINTATTLLNKKTAEKGEKLYLILAFSQKNLGHLDQAIQTLQKGYQHFPKGVRILIPLVDFLVENKQAELATDTFIKTALDTPEKLQVGINLMQTLLEHKEPGLALSVSQKLPRNRLGFSDQIQYLTAISLAELGQKERAIETMKTVDGALETNATTQLALWLYEEGNEQDINAMVLSRSSRENMPEQISAISHLHEEKGNPDLSYELVNQALNTLPESDTLRYHKALLADTLGDWKTTETELNTLLKKDPNNPQYLNALGYTLLIRTKRIDEAIAYIESAYEKSENDPAIIDSLGWGFFLKGEFEQSSYYLKKAWSILPDAEIAAHYGESLWQQRHYKEAISIWKKALETSPNDSLLLDTIKRLSPSLLETNTQETAS